MNEYNINQQKLNFNSIKVRLERSFFDIYLDFIRISIP